MTKETEKVNHDLFMHHSVYRSAVYILYSVIMYYFHFERAFLVHWSNIFFFYPFSHLGCSAELLLVCSWGI